MRASIPVIDAAWALPAGQAAWVQQQLLADLAARPDEMLALSVSMPFCAVHCLCCGRDITAGQPQQALDGYMQRLTQEIHNLAGHIGGGRELMQLHLGGGSANLFTESSLIGLMQTLRQHWRIPGDAELSIECDPRRVGWVQLELLHGLGFSDVQFGVLDLDPLVQRAIGRLQSGALVDDACGLARACGIRGVTLGLVVGLPCQTPASWRDTLRRVVAMAPGRIQLQRYCHRPWRSAGQCVIDAHALPDPHLARDLMALGADELAAVGYRWVGADLFVLEDDPLSVALDEDRLRCGLIGHTGLPAMPTLGVGRGALSELDGCLLCNHTDPGPWQSAVDQGQLPVGTVWQADTAARRRRMAAEHLLCRQELPADLLADDLEPVYQDLVRHAPPGSLAQLDGRLVVTAAGRPVLQHLCASLAGLPAGAPPHLPAWLG